MLKNLVCRLSRLLLRPAVLLLGGLGAGPGISMAYAQVGLPGQDPLPLAVQQALAAANEAVALASEAQYDAEVCGLKAVVTHAIDAESRAIDARDQIEVAYTNAKKAKTAKNLGDLRYYMRKSLDASRLAAKAAEDASYAAVDSFHSCTHSDTASAGGN